MDEDLGFRFTWYGHSCILIDSEAGTRILFDPWFGNPRSRTAEHRPLRHPPRDHGHHVPRLGASGIAG
jgi:L-ascorbate metabolism protein UlaG (beta-lactamase superfamily)